MRAAIARRPDYAEAHYMLGTVLKQAGKLGEAAAALREAIRLDPSTPGPFNTLGQLLRQQGDLEGSRAMFAEGARIRRSAKRSRKRCSTGRRRRRARRVRCNRNDAPLHAPGRIALAEPDGAVFSFDSLMAPVRRLLAQKAGVEFVNVAREAGLKAKTVSGDERKNRYLVKTTGCGVAFFDYDNDGWDDLFISYWGENALYRNNGDGTFRDVSKQAGILNTPGTYGLGVLVADFDNDGELDVVVNGVNEPSQLRCDSAAGNRWLKVKCVGTKSNRSAIGARVYCTPAGGKQQMDEVRSGGSYFSQSDPRVHFGLGKAEKADVDVRWPSGAVDRIAGVKANQVLRIVESRTGQASTPVGAPDVFR
jgi:ASPIC/UnbV protein/VCBS repeat protein/tetratricopeptide repeat protein